MGRGGARSQEALTSGMLGRGGGNLYFFPASPDTSSPFPALLRFLQQIMKDKWINIGYEGEELKPYTEPEEDFGDTKRIGEGQRARAPGPGEEPPSPTPPVGASATWPGRGGSESLAPVPVLCFLAVWP